MHTTRIAKLIAAVAAGAIVATIPVGASAQAGETSTSTSGPVAAVPGPGYYGPYADINVCESFRYAFDVLYPTSSRCYWEDYAGPGRPAGWYFWSYAP
ncbi:hypothetical protein GCM10009733_106050 [Nonomuraea maheshkhaliensis]|uniref:Secreted protein n=1 Tax=Nonomuraea maheshkhaliensis TaxID=419590 RepID=A0ABN2HSY0_9ACTN